ncbi:hypothetical protein SLEP1_g38503 [Rubroshorea leprosula]|nr:hypothetical protein SLEP1_g38503 [Rubroshorea leprosula]
MSGAGIIIISPASLKTQMSFQLDFNCTNNQAEYEALIIGLEVLVELKLLEEFDDVILRHVTRDLNIEANEMTQIASCLKIPEGVMSRIVVVKKRILPSIHMRDEYCQIMSYVHNGIYGAHQVGIKMRWLIRKHGFFWPSILKDCISYAKGCKACQIHGPLDFRSGDSFVGAQVEAFAKEMGFRLLTSTSHYAQANGQAEVSNRIVINLLEKMVDDNPRRWHELLSNTIWAYRTSQRSSTKVTPFSLTYGHDAVLPMELSTRSLRIVIQHGLTSGEYNEAMILELEDLEGMRLTALNRLQTQKLKVARAYNKQVKSKSLAEGDLVWKVILPPGKKDPRFGKWFPNWEGPFRIPEVLREGAYWLESLNGELYP